MSAKSKKWFRFRIATLLAMFLVLFCVLVFRAFHLQIMTGKTYKNLAEKQHNKTLQLHPERGIIFDRNGEKLAASILADSVFADPSKIDNVEEAAAQLAAVTGQPKKAIAQQIAKAKNFCWVARMITPAQSEQIKNLKMEGVYLIQEPKRFYPSRELAGQLIGFVGMDSNGLEGLEMRYDSYLRGEPEKILWGRDARGKKLYLPERSVTGKKDEQLSLVLTLDSRIQHAVESNLKEAVLRTRARGGFIIVMDPRTGEILAMANSPVFNPNAYASATADNKRNKAITDCFDPGSTFKPFLVAAAIEEGVVKESDRFNCENGAYRVANATFHEANRKRHGVLTVREILKYSSNIGSVKISEKLGREKFHRYIKDFGFGQKTNIELPGEISGLLRPWKNWTQVDTSTVAFGQGISVTAIQLVSALSAIANDGVLMQPHIVKKFVDVNGETVREFTPTAVRRVISADTARTDDNHADQRRGRAGRHGKECGPRERGRGRQDRHGPEIRLCEQAFLQRAGPDLLHGLFPRRGPAIRHAGLHRRAPAAQVGRRGGGPRVQVHLPADHPLLRARHRGDAPRPGNGNQHGREDPARVDPRSDPGGCKPLQRKRRPSYPTSGE